MTETDWHAPPALLARFAHEPTAVDDMTASSIEAHLVACAACRQALAASVDASLAEESWAALADRIDQPRAGILERCLRRIGVRDAMARLLAATAGLQAAAIAAIAVMAWAAVVLSRTADAAGPFLVLAPLAPLAAVAATFAPVADPAGEASIATPIYGVGLVVRRAAAVLTATFVVLGLAMLAVPDLGPSAAAWVLPALALALSALALGTWLRVEVAVGVLGVGWIWTVWGVHWLARSDVAGRGLPVADSPTFTLAGQLTALALVLAATAVIVVRRDRFATLEALQ